MMGVRVETGARRRLNLAQSPGRVAALALALGGIVGGAAAFGPLYVLAGMLALLAGYAILVSTAAGLLSVFAISADRKSVV